MAIDEKSAWKMLNALRDPLPERSIMLDEAKRDDVLAHLPVDASARLLEALNADDGDARLPLNATERLRAALGG